MATLNEQIQQMQAAEKQLFSVYPLLGVGKTVIQVAGLPLVTTGAMAHAPLVGPAVGSAVAQGSHFLHSHIHNLAAARISNNFTQIASNMDPGLWNLKQTAFETWAKVRTADMLAKTDMWARPLSGLASPALIGKGMLDAGGLVINQARQITISNPIANSIKVGNYLVNRAQQWFEQTLSNLPEHIQQNIKQGLAKVKETIGVDRNNQPQQVPETITSDQSTQVEPPSTVTNTQSTQVELNPSQTEDPAVQPWLNVEPSPPLELDPLPQQQAAPDLTDPNESRSSDGESEGESPYDRVAANYFQSLGAELQGRGIGEAQNMQVIFNGQDIFQLDNGQPDPSNTIAQLEHMKLFQQALANPADFQGDLEITVGGRVLLSIVDGQVFDPMNKIQDLVNVKLNAPSQSTPETTTQGFYEKYSEGVNTNNLNGLSQVAERAIDAGHSQGEIKSMLLENSDYLKDVSSRQTPEVAQQSADDIIQTASDRIIEREDLVQTQTQAQSYENTPSY